MSRELIIEVVAIAAATVMGWRYRQRDAEWMRPHIRRLYLDSTSPIWMRKSPALTPYVIIEAVTLVVGLVLPRPVGRWMFLPMGLGFLYAVLVIYLSPTRHPPRWLVQEIEEGTTPLASPRLLDWVTFAVLIGIGIAGTVSIAIGIVVFNWGAAVP